MMKWTKIAAIGVCAALLISAVLVAASSYFLQSGYAQRFIQKKIGDAIPGTVGWGSLSVSIYSGRIELERAVMKGPDEESLIGFERLYLDLALRRLLKGELVVEELVLESPWAKLRVDQAGGLNLTDALPPPGEADPEEPKTGLSFPFNVIVTSARITGGSVQYRMDRQEQVLNAVDISAALSGDLFAGNGELSFGLGQASADPYDPASTPAVGNIDGIRLDMSLMERLLTIDRLRIDLASGHLDLTGSVDLATVFPDGIIGEMGSLEELSYDLHLNGEEIALEKLVTMDSNPTGILSPSIDMAGTGLSPETLSANAAIDMRGAHLRAQGVSEPVDAHIAATVSVLDGVVSLDRLSAVLGALQLTSEARYSLSDQLVSGKVDLDAPDLSAIGMGNIRGGFHLKADVSGSVDGPGLDVRATGRDLGFGDVTLGNISLISNLAPSGSLKIESLLLENQGSKLSGHGSVGILAEGRKPSTRFPMELTLLMADIEARDFVAHKIADGTLNGSLGISGDLNALQASISLDAEKVAVEATRVGDLNLAAHLERGTVFVDAFRVTNNRSEFTIQGNARVFEPDSLRILSPPTFDVQVRGDRIFAEDFTDRVKGKFAVDARIGGSPLQPEGSAVLKGVNIDLGVQKLHSIAVSAALKNREVILDAFSIGINENESLEGKGRFEMPGSYEIELLSDGISLSSIDRVRALDLADGQIILSLNGEGQLDNPTVTGDITIRELEIHHTKVADISIHLDVEDQLARIVARLGFDLEASYHLAKRDFSSTVTFQETDLDPYMGIAGQEDLTGRLSGKITAGGNVEHPKGIHAEAVIDRLNVFSQDGDLVEIQDALVQLAEETFTLSNLTLALPEDGSVDVRGQGNLNGPLDLEIEGILPASVAGPFVEQMADADGEIAVSARISGHLPEPDIRADVALRDIQVTVPVLMQKLHSLNGEIGITKDGMQIRDMEGRLDTGTFSIRGEVALADFRPTRIDVDIAADTLPVTVPDTLDMFLSSEIQIRGDSDRSVVNGDLTILEGTFYRDIELGLGNVIGGKKRRTSVAPTAVKDPFLKNMELDLHVHRRNPFIVDNNLAYLDIKPDLQISGQVYAPVVSGRATIESGTVHYQKKGFTVKRGVIDFLNPYKIEPTLDLENEAVIRDWIITLSISGTPDAMVLKLASDPPEEDGDILSLLLIGKTTKELIAGEGGSSQSPSQILSDLVAAKLGEDVRKVTGLDVFELEGAGSENVKITIGNELSRRSMVIGLTKSRVSVALSACLPAQRVRGSPSTA